MPLALSVTQLTGNLQDEIFNMLPPDPSSNVHVPPQPTASRSNSHEQSPSVISNQEAPATSPIVGGGTINIFRRFTKPLTPKMLTPNGQLDKVCSQPIHSQNINV
jgi:hypothetical protein